MTNSELIDDNSDFAVSIRSSKLVSAHLFHWIRGARLQQGRHAGAQAAIYCCGNIQRDRNPPHSFIHSNASRSCGAASVDPADAFHHSEPRRRELRSDLVELSLRYLSALALHSPPRLKKNTHRRSFYAEQVNCINRFASPGGNITAKLTSAEVQNKIDPGSVEKMVQNSIA